MEISPKALTQKVPKSCSFNSEKEEGESLTPEEVIEVALFFLLINLCTTALSALREYTKVNIDVTVILLCVQWSLPPNRVEPTTIIFFTLSAHFLSLDLKRKQKGTAQKE